MRAVAPLATATWSFFATSTAAPGLPALRTTASTLSARGISGCAIGAASAFTAATFFAVSMTTLELPSATATATAISMLLATAMAAAG